MYSYGFIIITFVFLFSSNRKLFSSIDKAFNSAH